MPCGRNRCPHCGVRARGKAFFRSHAKRLRYVRVIDGRMVRRLVIPLRRWRCPQCRSSFADYPPFLVPKKQYALPELHLRAKSYVEKEGVTYRTGVSETGLPIFHDTPLENAGSAGLEDESGAAPVLSHTTLYRWVTTFGQIGSASDTGRSERVSPRKYKTESRRWTLGSCLALFEEPGFMISQQWASVHRLRNRSRERGC
jgi:hypothetical protein